MNENIMKWARAALVRAVKTGAEVMGGFVVVGVAVEEVQWAYAASVTAVAVIASLLASVKGIPEAAGGASVAKIAGGGDD